MTELRRGENVTCCECRMDLSFWRPSALDETSVPLGEPTNCLKLRLADALDRLGGDGVFAREGDPVL